MKQKHRDKWLDRTLVRSPYCYRLCLTEKEFHKELKRLKVKRHLWPSYLSTSHADCTVHYFERPGHYCAIVCMREDKDRPMEQVVGILAHEAVHIWQSSMEVYGESAPSREMEAYSIQCVTQELFRSYMEQTR